MCRLQNEEVAILARRSADALDGEHDGDSIKRLLGPRAGPTDVSNVVRAHTALQRRLEDDGEAALAAFIDNESPSSGSFRRVCNCLGPHFAAREPEFVPLPQPCEPRGPQFVQATWQPMDLSRRVASSLSITRTEPHMQTLVKALRAVWTRWHTAVQHDDGDQLPDIEDGRRPCWELGTCVCSAPGKLARRLRDNFWAVVRKCFRAGSAQRIAMKSTEVSMLLIGQRRRDADGDAVAYDFVTSCVKWYHMGHVDMAKWKCGLMSLKCTCADHLVHAVFTSNLVPERVQVEAVRDHVGDLQMSRSLDKELRWLVCFYTVDFSGALLPRLRPAAVQCSLLAGLDGGVSAHVIWDPWKQVRRGADRERPNPWASVLADADKVGDGDSAGGPGLDQPEDGVGILPLHDVVAEVPSSDESMDGALHFLGADSDSGPEALEISDFEPDMDLDLVFGVGGGDGDDVGPHPKTPEGHGPGPSSPASSAGDGLVGGGAATPPLMPVPVVVPDPPVAGVGDPEPAEFTWDIPGVGRLCWYRKSGDFYAYCKCQNQLHRRCQKTRSSKASLTRPSQGRPLGLLYAWLLAGQHPEVKDSPHHKHRVYIDHTARLDARTRLVEMCAGSAALERLLGKEREPREFEGIEPLVAP